MFQIYTSVLLYAGYKGLLASPDALEVIVGTYSLSVSTDLTDVTLVNDDTYVDEEDYEDDEGEEDEEDDEEDVDDVDDVDDEDVMLCKLSSDKFIW